MFPYLGLKASTDSRQIDERLQYQPTVFEFYTQADDVAPSGLIHLRAMIDKVRNSGVQAIVIHHPMSYLHYHNEVAVKASQHPRAYDFVMSSTETLIEVAQEKDVQLLVHGAYNEESAKIEAEFGSIDAARTLAFKRLDYFQSLGGDHVMFENSISPIFDFGNPVVDQLVQQRGYRLAFDVSHAFIVLRGDNTLLQETMRLLGPQVVHYHLVDSMGMTHDSLPLGTGAIDWQGAASVMNPKATNIYEIDLNDQYDSREMRESHHYFSKIWRQEHGTM